MDGDERSPGSEQQQIEKNLEKKKNQKKHNFDRP